MLDALRWISLTRDHLGDMEKAVEIDKPSLQIALDHYGEDSTGYRDVVTWLMDDCKKIGDQATSDMYCEMLPLADTPLKPARPVDNSAWELDRKPGYVKHRDWDDDDYDEEEGE